MPASSASPNVTQPIGANAPEVMRSASLPSDSRIAEMNAPLDMLPSGLPTTIAQPWQPIGPKPMLDSRPGRSTQLRENALKMSSAAAAIASPMASWRLSDFGFGFRSRFTMYLADPDGYTGAAVASYSIFSHHWHHHSPPTRMRSLGCQQYEMPSSGFK